MMMRAGLVTIGGGLLLLAGGCKSIVPSCHKPQAYAEATELPPLRVPVGLDGLDTARAMQIPPVGDPAVPPRGPRDPCLEEPPSIITTSTPDPVALPGEGSAAGESGGRRPRRPPQPR